MGYGKGAAIARADMSWRKRVFSTALGFAALGALAIPASSPRAGDDPPATKPSVPRSPVFLAQATARRFAIPPQPLAAALRQFGQQSGMQVSFPSEIAQGVSSPGVSGTLTPEAALRRLLGGTGLTFRIGDGGTVTLTRPEPASDVTRLPSMTVTALRARRPLSAIPGSVTVITREQIREQLDLTSNPSRVLSKLVPGYSVSSGSISNASENFRGRNVLVMVDGVPRNTPLRDVARIVSMIDLRNVERIEVIGGSSSIYGGGATGGIINFVTKPATPGKPRVTAGVTMRANTAAPGPSLEPEVSVGVSGTSKMFDYSGVITGRFANKTYDGSGNERPSDPFLGQGGSDHYDRLNTSFKVGKNFDARRIEFSFDWTYYNQKPDYLTAYVPYRYVPGQGYVYDLGAPSEPNKALSYPGQSILEDSKYLTLRFSDPEFQLGKLDFRAFHHDIKKRFAFSEAGLANPIVYYNGLAGPGSPIDPNTALLYATSPDNQTTQKSQRSGFHLSIDSNLGRLVKGMRLTWGMDYSYENTRQVFVDDVNAIAPMKQHSVGLFGQLEVPITKWVTVRGGVRYDYFNLAVSNFVRPSYRYMVPTTTAATYPGIAYAPVLVPPVEVIGGSFTYDQVTFNLGAVLNLSKQVKLFAGFSQGFALPDVGAFTRRAGTNTGFAFPTDPIDYSSIGPKPQLVNTYEVGARANFRRFRGSLTGFISTSEYGVNFDPSTNTIVQQKEMIWGIEFKGEVDVTQDLTLGAVISYREGKRDTTGDGALDAYLPNNRIPTPFRMTLFGQYRFSGSFARGLFVRGELEYYGGRDVDDGTVYYSAYELPSFEAVGGYPSLKLKPVTLVNILLAYPLRKGELGTVTFGIQNLFDATYDNPTATAVRNIPVLGLGRVVSLGYRVTF